MDTTSSNHLSKYSGFIDPFQNTTPAPRIPDATVATNTHVSRSVREIRLSPKEIESIIESNYIYWFDNKDDIDSGADDGPLTTMPNPTPVGAMTPFLSDRYTRRHVLSYDIKVARLFVVHNAAPSVNYQVYLYCEWSVIVLTDNSVDPDATTAGQRNNQFENDVPELSEILQQGYGRNVILKESFLVYSDTSGVPLSYEVDVMEGRDGVKNYICSDQSENGYTGIRLVSAGLRCTNLDPLNGGLWFSRSVHFTPKNKKLVFRDGYATFNGDLSLPYDCHRYHNAWSRWQNDFTFHGHTTLTGGSGLLFNNLNEMFRDAGFYQGTTAERKSWHRRAVDQVRFNYYGGKAIDNSDDFFNTSNYPSTPNFQSGSMGELNGTKQWNVIKTSSPLTQRYVPVEDYLIQTESIFPPSKVSWRDYETQLFRNPWLDNSFRDCFSLYAAAAGYRPVSYMEDISYVGAAFDVVNPTWVSPSFLIWDTSANPSTNMDVPYPVPAKFGPFDGGFEWPVKTSASSTLLATGGNYANLTLEELQYRFGDRLFWMTTDVNKYHFDAGHRYRGHFPLTGSQSMEKMLRYSFPQDQKLTVLVFDDVDLSVAGDDPNATIFRILLETQSNFECHKRPHPNKDFFGSDPYQIHSNDADDVVSHQFFGGGLNSTSHLFLGIPQGHHGDSSMFQSSAQAMNHSSNASLATSAMGGAIGGGYDPWSAMQNRLQERRFQEEQDFALKQKEEEEAKRKADAQKNWIDKVESFLEHHKALEDTVKGAGMLGLLGLQFIPGANVAADSALAAGAGAEGLAAGAGGLAEAEGLAAGAGEGASGGGFMGFLRNTGDLTQHLTNLQNNIGFRNLGGAANDLSNIQRLVGRGGTGRLLGTLNSSLRGGATAEAAAQEAAESLGLGAESALPTAMEDEGEELITTPRGGVMEMSEIPRSDIQMTESSATATGTTPVNVDPEMGREEWETLMRLRDPAEVMDVADPLDEFDEQFDPLDEFDEPQFGDRFERFYEPDETPEQLADRLIRPVRPFTDAQRFPEGEPEFDEDVDWLEQLGVPEGEVLNPFRESEFVPQGNEEDHGFLDDAILDILNNMNPDEVPNFDTYDTYTD